ncbi:MAG: M48 family metalloprotease [Candidatus Liptonbacteria bacterium]|nr:M48 family metalloprotease [Candidatus Liptonbacteria bacterium]
MNLTQYKERNIGRTSLLLAVFLLVVLGLGWVFSYVFNSRDIFIFAVLFSVGMSAASYWFSDKLALAFAKAEPIQREDNPELWDTVQRLATAAQLPMPRLYLTPEPQINAFATGRDPAHAAVAVTIGALTKLSKPELEGVLAHELSHISNRDMLVSTVAVVLAGIISMLADVFLRMLWFGGDDNRDSRSGWLMVAGVALSILAPVGAMLIQFAVSRQREALADASGALLTQRPGELANALEKIGADKVPMSSVHEATAHLWIDNPFKGKTPWWHKLFMTHPPIEERVRALRQVQ